MTIRQSKDMGGVPFGLVATLFGWLNLAMTAHADTRVVFSRLTDGPAFEEAMAYFDSHFEPEAYWPSKLDDDWEAARHIRTPQDALVRFLRKFVVAGRGDVNGDGIDERFYIVEHPGWCGSAGCSTDIVEHRGGAMNNICSVGGTPDHVWITDRVTIHGYHELKAVFGIRWRKDECISDSPQIRDMQPEPDGSPPPPPRPTRLDHGAAMH